MRKFGTFLSVCQILGMPNLRHLSVCCMLSKFWGPKYKEHMDLLEGVQRMDMKMIRGFGHPSCEEDSCEGRLRKFTLFSPEKRL